MIRGKNYWLKEKQHFCRLRMNYLKSRGMPIAVPRVRKRSFEKN